MIFVIGQAPVPPVGGGGGGDNSGGNQHGGTGSPSTPNNEGCELTMIILLIKTLHFMQ